MIYCEGGEVYYCLNDKHTKLSIYYQLSMIFYPLYKEHTQTEDYYVSVMFGTPQITWIHLIVSLLKISKKLHFPD